MVDLAIKIKFDHTNNIIPPTLILLTKSGRRLGQIPALSLTVKDYLNSCSELSFVTYKDSYVGRESLWNKIEDFKLIWVKDWNKCFEITVETVDGEGIYKNITAKALGESELSQINVYTTEINTEDDIDRKDYVPTVLYNEENSNASLLNRITEKVPHYEIYHVDDSIKNIQRTFSFDEKSVMDCFKEISEEINCLFIIDCGFDANWNMYRRISVYDLESVCLDCGERGEFIDTCSNCGSSNILKGYGNDTGIFINTENLTDEITYGTDNGSVKNCFKLTAGDDLMTATIKNANPNGSSYIWYITDDMKSDMSNALVTKLTGYNNLYDYYENEYQAIITQTELADYNNLITKYSVYSSDYPQITYPIMKFSGIMEANYNTIDFYLFLESGLMPAPSMSSTTAITESYRLASGILSPVAVPNISTCSATTADSAVLSAAKTIVDSNYKVTIDYSTYYPDTHEWAGQFIITNNSDETDTATTSLLVVAINDDYGLYVGQKIKRTLSRKVAKGEPVDIVSIFDLSLNDFKNEIKKYCLSRLKSFYDSCQACLDVLTEQGIADKSLWVNQNPDLYTTIYLPYFRKLEAIESEIQVRENELAIIIGTYDSDGNLITKGLQTLINKERQKIQNNLNLERYLGTTLWNELCLYRREDTYKNDNYISDGLDNAGLFKKALEFIKNAKKEIIKSATLQHSISSTLKNLLVMPEFSPIVNQFEVGNWLRARVDGKIYKLRLVEYEIEYDTIEKINVNFSDVIENGSSITDIKKILDQANIISSTYDNVSRQAEQGSDANKKYEDWIEKGFDVTNTKIICTADYQTYTSDEHGMVFKRYDPIEQQYDNRQLKIINSSLAITDDNWETIKTAVGYYYYFDPVTNKLKQAYGVIGETIIGKLLLGERLGIYNSTNSLTFDENGLNITNNKNTFKVDPNNSNKLLSISRTYNNNTEDIFYVDGNGVLHIKGDGAGLDITSNNTITGMSSQLTQNANDITAIVTRNGQGTIVSLDYSKVKIAWNSISQYIQFEDYNNKASIGIYDSDDSTTKKILMRLNYEGMRIYDGTTNNNLLMRLNSNGLTLFDSGNTLMRLHSDGINVYSNDSDNLLRIKLYSTGVSIYGQYSGDNTNYCLTRLSSTGSWYYYKNDTIGKVGTNSWSNDETYTGLVFDLNNTGSFISWSYQETQQGGYNPKLLYCANDNKQAERLQKGLHIYDDAYCEARMYIRNVLFFTYYDSTLSTDVPFGLTAIYRNSTTNEFTGFGFEAPSAELYITGKEVNFAVDYDSNRINKFRVGNTVIDCFQNLDMHNFSILNQSDERLKKNIVDTEVNALSVINQISLKSFDWIENDSHEDIGIIAQQLQEVLPDLVVEDAETGKLSITLVKFIPYILKAIQELSGSDTSDKKSETKGKRDKRSYSLEDKIEFVETVKDKQILNLTVQEYKPPKSICLSDSLIERKEKKI